MEPNKNLFGPVVQANIAQGEAITAETYHAPSIDVFRDVGAFITPTHPFVAPPLTVNAEGDAGVRQFTVPISYTGFPAISPSRVASTRAGYPSGCRSSRTTFRSGCCSGSPVPSKRPPIFTSSVPRSTAMETELASES